MNRKCNFELIFLTVVECILKQILTFLKNIKIKRIYVSDYQYFTQWLQKLLSLKILKQGCIQIKNIVKILCWNSGTTIHTYRSATLKMH